MFQTIVPVLQAVARQAAPAVKLGAGLAVTGITFYASIAAVGITVVGLGAAGYYTQRGARRAASAAWQHTPTFRKVEETAPDSPYAAPFANDVSAAA